jgi:hypothetical protein
LFFCFDGDICSLVGFYARSWGFMLVRGDLCSLVGFYARPWRFMLARGGFICSSVEIYARLGGYMFALRNLYSPSGFYVRSRNFRMPAITQSFRFRSSLNHLLSKVSCTLFTVKGVFVFLACVIIFGLKTL